MHDLTARQVEILKSLIEEYIETAEPVGSETLEKKHNLSRQSGNNQKRNGSLNRFRLS